MDGDRDKLGKCPDMRKHVGAGTCDCCDYCRPLPDGKIVLVEMTDLTRDKRKHQRDFARARLGLGKKSRVTKASPALEDKGGDKYATECVIRKNRLKVYGGMLVLCRYAAQCARFAKLVRGGKKISYLVVSRDVAGMENAMDLEYWRGKLLEDLRGLLSSDVIEDVKVLSPDELVRELPQGGDIPRS